MPAEDPTNERKTDRFIDRGVSDAVIKDALENAHVPSLLLSLVHLTGEMRHIRGEVRPDPAQLRDPQDGLSAVQQAEARAYALDVIRKARDDESKAKETLNEEELSEMMAYLTGGDVEGTTIEFLRAELSMHGEDAYAQPNLARVQASDLAELDVLIIGAGMSGLLSAIRLKEAGVPFRVVEKNADVGGTWLENTYPGCRVDSGNHVYSYSFRPKDWPQYFSSQPVLREYFQQTADEYDLRRHIQFETEVLSARLDEARGIWVVTVRRADGSQEQMEAHVVISAVGQLNRPKLPDIEGAGSFTGPCFHSARWRHDVDFAGKRVGVIGTGGSAFQFVPHLAEDGADVTVFQRTAPWVLPNEQYFSEIPEGVHWLMNHLPFYAKWYRLAVFWKSAEGLLPSVRADEGWDHPEPSVGAENEALRAQLVAILEDFFPDDPELLRLCTPDYPPGAKRALVDDGRWFRTLTQPNVHLTDTPIAKITPTGIETRDGAHHEFDVLIYGTGFTASDFLMPMDIYGVGGQELHEMWAGDPRAYKGISFPGFPNLFCCYGPNTNIVVNSSIIFFSECEVRYILGCVAELAGRGAGTLMDVRGDVHDAYNERIDHGNSQMAWGQSTVNTWYKNAAGRITQNWPFSLVEFWQQSREPDPADYRFTQSG